MEYLASRACNEKIVGRWNHRNYTDSTEETIVGELGSS